MFVVKNPTIFAKDVIPQYFDHSKFTSFARQLNFYGFRKMQIKPLRNDEYDQETSKYVTFHNEKFMRGRQDLLSQIHRSTKGGAASANQEQQAEIQELKGKVQFLEGQVYELHNTMQEMEEHHQRQWQAFIHQFQHSNYATNITSSDHNQQSYSTNMTSGDHNQQNYSTVMASGDNDQHQNLSRSHEQNSTLSGERTSSYPNYVPSYGTVPDVTLRETAKVTTSEDAKEAKPRQPTLKRHPNSKTLPENAVMPPPPRADPAFRGASRGISFMRGFSTEYADMGLFEKAEQVIIPQPHENINEMQQPDLSSFQQRYFQSMMSDPEIRTSEKEQVRRGLSPPDSSNLYEKHAAKNMETLQNLNINCNEIEKPEMKRVPTVDEPLPPL